MSTYFKMDIYQQWTQPRFQTRQASKTFSGIKTQGRHRLWWAWCVGRADRQGARAQYNQRESTVIISMHTRMMCWQRCRAKKSVALKSYCHITGSKRRKAWWTDAHL